MNNTSSNQSPTDIFQAALDQGDYLLQQCRECGQMLATPSAACVHCKSQSFKWIEASGWGVVLSSRLVQNAETDNLMITVKLEEGIQVEAPVIAQPNEQFEPGTKVLAHIALREARPVILFTAQDDEEEDEW